MKMICQSKNLKIVRFLGGLGNQMFQYAFYKALSKKYADVRVDISRYKYYSLHNGYEIERIFKINTKKATPFEIKLLEAKQDFFYKTLKKLLSFGNTYREEVDLFCYDKSWFDVKGPSLFRGYWQNHQYFCDFQQELRQDFIFPQLKGAKNIALYNEILNTDNTVALHVRRGDYLDNHLLGGFATLEYFNKAVELIKNKIIHPKFYVFSDDIEWCLENLQLNNASYVNWNKGCYSYIDMQLISICMHSIISNSSFSWWGSYLNKNQEKIVIVPKNWFFGIDVNKIGMHPKEWIAL